MESASTAAANTSGAGDLLIPRLRRTHRAFRAGWLSRLSSPLWDGPRGGTTRADGAGFLGDVEMAYLKRCRDNNSGLSKYILGRRCSALSVCGPTKMQG